MNTTLPSRPTRIALAVGTAVALAGAQAMAAERAGRVLAVTGTVVASTPGGGTRTLDDGSRVYTGERIDTHDGRVQIRFLDGGIVSLQPNTRFGIERYHEPDPAVGEQGGGNVLMRLFRGTMRTISGFIGDDPDEHYRLETPVATVGIRGTEYALVYCDDGSCGEGVEGLYGHVNHGSISVTNAGGSGIFSHGGYFRVLDDDRPPEPILQPPGDLLSGAGPGDETGDEDGNENGDENDGGDQGLEDGGGGGAGEGEGPVAPHDDEPPGSDLTEPQFSEAEDSAAVVTGGLENAAVAAAYIAGSLTDGGACRTGVDCFAQIDDDGALRAIAPDDAASVSVPDGAKIFESGTVPALGVKWGHWRGDLTIGGSDLPDSDFIWAYSDNPTSQAELAGTFTAGVPFRFSLSTGPMSIATSGESWMVTKLDIDMTSNAGKVTIDPNDVRLTLQGDHTIDLANGSSVVIDPATGELAFDVALDSTDVGSYGPDDGILSGTFVGDDAEGLLVEFEAHDVEDGEMVDVIQGVKILEFEPAS